SCRRLQHDPRHAGESLKMAAWAVARAMRPLLAVLAPGSARPQPLGCAPRNREGAPQARIHGTTCFHRDPPNPPGGASDAVIPGGRSTEDLMKATTAALMVAAIGAGGAACSGSSDPADQEAPNQKVINDGPSGTPGPPASKPTTNAAPTTTPPPNPTPA